VTGTVTGLPMPMYEYKCPKCGHEFDRIVRHADREAPQKCPECEHGAATRQMSKSTSFVLKGGGWAKDGYGG